MYANKSEQELAELRGKKITKVLGYVSVGFIVFFAISALEKFGLHYFI